jgi:hypothetical protein
MEILGQIFGRGPARDETPRRLAPEVALEIGELIAGQYAMRKLLMSWPLE